MEMFGIHYEIHLQIITCLSFHQEGLFTGQRLRPSISNLETRLHQDGYNISPLSYPFIHLCYTHHAPPITPQSTPRVPRRAIYRKLDYQALNGLPAPILSLYITKIEPRIKTCQHQAAYQTKIIPLSNQD